MVIYTNNIKLNIKIIIIGGEINMARIYIRRYKRNPDFWEVVGGGNNVQVMSKTKAKEIAASRRRIRAKRK